jgi:putative oxidoreductase
MEKILRLHRCVLHFDATINEWGGSLISLAIRLYVGLQFFKAGLTKIADWSSTLALFRDEYHVPVLPPELAAAMGTMGELGLPLLLFIGLLSRPAALGLFFVNLMAVISYPTLFQFDCTAALNDHFSWGALLLVVAAFGGANFSMDYWLSRSSK